AKSQELTAKSLFTASKSSALALSRPRSAQSARYSCRRPLPPSTYRSKPWLRTARVHHRLDRQHHALGQLGALAFLAEVRNLRRLVQLRSDAVPDKFPNYAEARRFHVLLDRRSNVPNRVANLHLLDAPIERCFGYFEQLLQFRREFVAYRYRNGGVSVIAVEDHTAVDRNDVARLEDPLFRRDPMHDLLVDRCAEHARIAVISLECRRCTQFRNQLLGGFRQVNRRYAGCDHTLQVIQHLANDVAAVPHLLNFRRRLADDLVVPKTHYRFRRVTPPAACTRCGGYRSRRKSAP